MRKPFITLALFLPLSVIAQVFNVQSVEQVTLPSGSEMVADISPDGNSLLLTTGNNRGLKSYNLTSGSTIVLSENEGAGYGACYATGKSTHTPFLPRDRDHIFRRKQHEPRKQAQNL